MDPVTSTPGTRRTTVREPAAPPAPAAYGTDVVAVANPPDIQQLRWGPIWAGLLTALGVFLLLTLAAVAVGLQAAPADLGDAAEDLGILEILVTSAIVLFSFFLGGFVSSWTAALTDPARSALNGFLVWALWLIVVIVMAALGLGTVVGAGAELFGAANTNVAAPEVEVEAQQVIDALRTSSWTTFLALALAAAAALLGGLVGARPDLRDRWRRPEA